MCPLILIENMYPLRNATKLEVLNDHQKDMCYDEIGLTNMCSKNIINNHFKFKFQRDWDDPNDRVNRNITITSLNLRNWSRTQKSKKMTVFTICDCQLDETLPDSIQQSKLCVELELGSARNRTAPFLRFLCVRPIIVLSPASISESRNVRYLVAWLHSTRLRFHWKSLINYL